MPKYNGANSVKNRYDRSDENMMAWIARAFAVTLSNLSTCYNRMYNHRCVFLSEIYAGPAKIVILYLDLDIFIKQVPWGQEKVRTWEEMVGKGKVGISMDAKRVTWSDDVMLASCLIVRTPTWGGIAWPAREVVLFVSLPGLCVSTNYAIKTYLKVK